MKSTIDLYRTITSAFFVVGAIALGAFIFRFPGLLVIKVGIEGGQVTIDSRQPALVK